VQADHETVLVATERDFGIKPGSLQVVGDIEGHA
jgi:hypothetical protein